MKILAIETSATAASCCIADNGGLLAQSFQNNGLTHSRTLMPMITDMLKNCGLTLSDMEVIAVAAGPGSFTGLRIGVAAAKGLAWPENKPVCGVSTLEAMARNLGLRSGKICCAMDARRKQVYNALFEVKDGELVRLCEDRAISLEELFSEERDWNDGWTVVGDGGHLCLDAAAAKGYSMNAAPVNLMQQSAWGVALGAMEQVKRGEQLPADRLVPNYLRLSQAERERLAKTKNA